MRYRVMILLLLILLMLLYVYYSKRERYEDNELEINFMAFADKKYTKTLDRIGNEAKDMSIFKGIYLLNESDLIDMPEDDLKFINNNARGYGYWLWKPYLIKKILSRTDEGSILVYADAGCKLDKNNKGRLIEWVNMVKNHDSNMLTFQMDLKEFIWTKIDTLRELDFMKGDELNSGQVCATVIIMRNKENVRRLIDEWYNIARKDNYHYLDDSPSSENNLDGFNDHRHDQSIFSILVKKNNIQRIEDETYGNAPIKATRIKF